MADLITVIILDDALGNIKEDEEFGKNLVEAIEAFPLSKSKMTVEDDHRVPKRTFSFKEVLDGDLTPIIAAVRNELAAKKLEE